MICPFLNFLTYLKSKNVSSIRDFIPSNLNYPEDIGKVGKTKKWRLDHNLEDIPIRTKQIYGLWHNTKARNLLAVHKIRRSSGNISELLFKLGQWVISQKEIDDYYDIFFNIEGLSSIELYEILSFVDNEDYYFLDLCLSDIPIELIYQKIGLSFNAPDPKTMLTRMLLKSYNEFEQSTDKQSLQWGNFAIKLIKVLEEQNKEDPQQVLRNLRLELGEPEIDHMFDDNFDLI